jgi:hypothetical protein
MRHACVVGRVGLEADGEDIVGIVARNMEVLCASLFMLEVQRRQLQLRDLLDALDSEAVELLSRLG